MKFVDAHADWRCTTSPGKLFIHIFNWPFDGRLKLPPFQKTIMSAKLLSGKKVRILQHADHMELLLPKRSPGALVSVVQISYAEEL